MKSNNMQVLVVDDEPLNVEILTEYLEDTKFKPVIAKNGTEAWELLSDSPEQFAAVLLDRMMPDMDGIKILEKLKNSALHKGLPVIMQTAASGKQEILEGLKAGAYYYLTKPFEKEMLLPIVETAVNDWLRYQDLKEEVNKGVRSMHMMHEGQFKFRTLEESRTLSAFLANACPDSEKVVLGLSELMVNAVEHGNLEITYQEKTELLGADKWFDEITHRLKLPEYNARAVDVQFQRFESHILITIRDQGKGFNWQAFQEMDPSRVSHRHGRGIAIANLMSFDGVKYHEPGNVVECYISLTANAE